MTTRTFPKPRSATTYLATRAVAALILAAGTNLILYILADAGWLGPTVRSPADFGIDMVDVAAMSIGPAIVAAVLLAALHRWAPRPRMAFLVVAVLVFGGFLVGPFTLGATAGTIALLEGMHLVVALSVVGLLLRGPRGDEGT